MAQNLSNESSQLMLSSARGSVILMIGQVAAALISAATIIWMSNSLGSEAYGQYTVALFPVSIALLFQDLGMNTSIMRFCAKYKHEEQYSKLKETVLTGLIFSVFTSVIISLIIYFLAGPIATVYLKHPEVEPLVRVASLAVLGSGGLVTTIQAIFIGHEIMTLRAALHVLWTILRAALSILLILTGLGAFGAVLANTISYFIAGLFGILLIIIFVKFEHNAKGGFSISMLKTLLSYGIPLSLSSLLNGILAQIYNYIMILFVTVDLIGNYGAATSFAVLIGFLVTPIANTLFPIFSKFEKGDPQVETIFRAAVQYTSMATLPVVLLIVALSTPLSQILYNPVDYPYVPLYLSIYILNYAWEGLGGFTLFYIITGVGESKVSLRASIITFITGVSLAILLVPRFGMAGLLVTIVLDGRGGWLYQTFWVKRELGISVDWGSSARIYFAAFTAFVASYAAVSLLDLQRWAALIVGGFTYLIVYLVCLPLSGALKHKDIRQLEKLLDLLGPIAPVAKKILLKMSQLAKN